MKVLSVGQCKYDMNVTVDKDVINQETDLSGGIECGGGRASAVAYLMGKYKHDSYIASTIGDDSFGQLIKKELEAVGVHTEYMETAFGKRSKLSYIINNTKDNSRTVYNVIKEPLNMKKMEFQIEPDLVYVDRFDYGAALSALNTFSKKITIISADEYNAEVMELCKYCKYIIATRKFAEKFTGQTFDLTNSQSLLSIYSSLQHKFPDKAIIITIDEQGALYSVDNQIRVMPSLNLEKKDTSNCSTIFDGAFAYALLEGYDIEKSVTFANIASGLSVLKVGCNLSIPDLSDIMTYFNQKYPKANE